MAIKHRGLTEAADTRAPAGRPRRRRALRSAVAALVGAALVVAGGNIAYAASEPATVSAVALPGPGAPPAPGTWVQVAALSTATPSTLSLAGDPTGRSFGCVSLSPSGTIPSSLLPNNPRAATPPNTFCAHRTPRSRVPSEIGYEVGFDVAKDPQRPNLAPQTPVAFGFVPAGTVRVRMQLSKRGPLIFRLLKPTTTVEARLFGASLHLPIAAWEGPDATGYTVNKIEAIDASGTVTAALRFGG